MLQIAVAAAAVTALCIVALDLPVARAIAAHDTSPALWNRGIALLEYPLGIEPWPWTGVCVLIAGALLALWRWPAHARTWLLVALVHVLARNLTMWLKWGTGRLRPSEWLVRGGHTWWRDDGYSFPSGHVTLFASILVPLALCVPRTRPLLAIVAFAMIARVAVNAHFLSDVFGALALCALLTWLCARLLRFPQ